MTATIVPRSDWPGPRRVLSPRTSIESVAECTHFVSDGQRMICLTAPFAVDDDLESALTLRCTGASLSQCNPADSPTGIRGPLRNAG
jgi:hypothetical protein